MVLRVAEFAVFVLSFLMEAVAFWSGRFGLNAFICRRNWLVSGVAAMPARIGLRSTYAMQATTAASSRRGWHL